jgi:UDP-N-acetylmuramoylalanine--D-glutamate ligase
MTSDWHVEGTPSWQDTRVCVVGARVAGLAAARALLDLGAAVTLVDRAADETTAARTADIASAGATVRLGDGDTLPEGTDLVVVSPGVPPTAAIAIQAMANGVPVWGDVELAWRLRRPLPDGSYAPWLVVTGTNGKTTTVRMLASMLTADGRRTVACGNVGLPVIDAVRADHDNGGPYEVLAIELSSFQLHWTYSMSAHSAVVLNLAPDHVDWHGSYDAYAADKARVYERCQVACVYNVEDEATRRLVEEADVIEGCRAIGFTLGAPSVGMVGVVDGILADRAFIRERGDSAAEIGTIFDVEPHAPHNIANALAAAALSRSYGVSVEAVRDGLRDFRPDPHRIALVASVGGVAFVDDSKATNAHAAAASLAAFDPVVWIAGGLAKGARFDDLIRESAGRLRGVVLIGADRALLAEALARHAPDVPVVEVGETDTESTNTDSVTGESNPMDRVVAAAVRLASPGDTVLLAPACASYDMFANYNARGDAFAASVRGFAAAASGAVDA